jgi:hypothetical protein
MIRVDDDGKCEGTETEVDKRIRLIRDSRGAGKKKTKEIWCEENLVEKRKKLKQGNEVRPRSSNAKYLML